jgi:hypothetical protein
MGQQPGQTAGQTSQPMTFDNERASRALQQFQTATNAAAAQNGTIRNRAYQPSAQPAPGFNELMNFYMQSAAGPAPAPAAPPVPTAFQQFRQQRAAGTGPVRRTMQYTPPTGPRMARDNRVAGDMQA